MLRADTDLRAHLLPARARACACVLHLLVLMHDILEPHNVEVRQLLEQADLSDGRGGHSLILRLQADLLQRHDLARHLVLRLVHHTVRALADLLQLRVALHALVLHGGVLLRHG